MDHKDQKFPCRQDNVGIGMNSSSFSLVQSWRFSLWNESDAMIARPAKTFRNQAKVGTGALIFSLSSLLSFARIFWCSFPRGKESHATTDTTHGHATSQPADLVVVLWMWESGIFDALSLDPPPQPSLFGTNGFIFFHLSLAPKRESGSTVRVKNKFFRHKLWGGKEAGEGTKKNLGWHEMK